MTSLSRDDNRIAVIGGTSSTDGRSVVPIYVDPTTHRVLVSIASISSLFTKDTFTSTNGQTTFTPSKTVAFDVYMSINGAIQTPATDYSIVGGDYVLNSGIPSGCAVILLYVNA